MIGKYNPKKLIGKFVLWQQRCDFHDELSAWIYIYVDREASEEQVTLAIATDDLCPLGFKDATNYWYNFSGGFKCLPRVVKLPIRDNWRQMIDGVQKILWNVPLGKQSVMHSCLKFAFWMYER